MSFLDFAQWATIAALGIGVCLLSYAIIITQRQILHLLDKLYEQRKRIRALEIKNDMRFDEIKEVSK